MKEADFLKKDEKLEDLELDGLHIIQSAGSYHFTSDSVLLANSVRALRGEKICDLGTGSGVIPLIVSAKTKASKIVGVEIQSEIANMAERSVKLNNLQDKISILNINLLDAPRILGHGAFDIVTANPPYFKVDKLQATSEENEVSRCAKYELSATLSDFVEAASKLLKFGGRLYLVSKIERLAECMTLFSNNKLEPKTITMVFPKPSKPADTFIVSATKNGKPGLKVTSLFCHEESGEMTPALKKIYGKA